MIELKGEDKIKSEPRSGDRDQVSNLPPAPGHFVSWGFQQYLVQWEFQGESRGSEGSYKEGIRRVYTMCQAGYQKPVTRGRATQAKSFAPEEPTCWCQEWDNKQQS